MAVDFLFAEAIAIPGLAWINLPIIRNVVKFIIQRLADALSKWGVMQAFFMNTAIRKASQAQDYVDLVNAKNKLPENASDEEYEKAERAEINAFTAFVAVTN